MIDERDLNTHGENTDQRSQRAVQQVAQNHLADHECVITAGVDLVGLTPSSKICRVPRQLAAGMRQRKAVFRYVGIHRQLGDGDGKLVVLLRTHDFDLPGKERSRRSAIGSGRQGGC